jgi:hypothetical protein
MRWVITSYQATDITSFMNWKFVILMLNIWSCVSRFLEDMNTECNFNVVLVLANIWTFPICWTTSTMLLKIYILPPVAFPLCIHVTWQWIGKDKSLLLHSIKVRQLFNIWLYTKVCITEGDVKHIQCFGFLVSFTIANRIYFPEKCLFLDHDLRLWTCQNT